MMLANKEFVLVVGVLVGVEVDGAGAAAPPESSLNRLAFEAEVLVTVAGVLLLGLEVGLLVKVMVLPLLVLAAAKREKILFDVPLTAGLLLGVDAGVVATLLKRLVVKELVLVVTKLVIDDFFTFFPMMYLLPMSRFATQAIYKNSFTYSSAKLIKCCCHPPKVVIAN